MNSRYIPRWYLLTFPYSRRGLTEGLEKELFRRRRDGESVFEYFAPTFVETKEVRGKLVATNTALLFNYLFIFASEAEIYRLKRFQPQYNFLSRIVRNDGSYYYPHVSESVIKTLRWIASSNNGCIPLYAIDPALLIKGDRVRIVSGAFKGVEATVVSRPRSEEQTVAVVVEGWMCIPLLNVKPDQYEVISLADMGEIKQNSHLFDDYQRIGQLFKALERFYQGQLTDDDRQLATDTYISYSLVDVDTLLMRCTLFTYLLPAVKILGYDDKFESLLKLSDLLLKELETPVAVVGRKNSTGNQLPSIKGLPHSYLFFALYACTDNYVYYQVVHRLSDAYRNTSNPKLSDLRSLITRYDQLFNHN